jgi:hypothetical protein
VPLFFTLSSQRQNGVQIGKNTRDGVLGRVASGTCHCRPRYEHYFADQGIDRRAFFADFLFTTAMDEEDLEMQEHFPVKKVSRTPVRKVLRSKKSKGM